MGQDEGKYGEDSPGGESPGKKVGRWQGGGASSFQAYQRAIRELLDEQEPGTTWLVEVEVKKVGNPIHDYRIVLNPR